MRKQAKMTLRCMQALVRVQSRILDQRIRQSHSHEGSRNSTFSDSNTLSMWDPPRYVQDFSDRRSMVTISNLLYIYLTIITFSGRRLGVGLDPLNPLLVGSWPLSVSVQQFLPPALMQVLGLITRPKVITTYIFHFRDTGCYTLPFNPFTSLCLTIPLPSRARLSIYRSPRSNDN